MKLSQGKGGLPARAYRNHAPEWVLYVMALSGVLLWDILGVSWEVYRWLMVVHAGPGMLAVLVWVLPFWWAHRKLYAVSRKRWLRASGRVLDGLLAAVIISGVWLIWVGNRGNELDGWIHAVHLYGTLMLAPLLIAHAWRWSVIRKTLMALCVLTVPAQAGAAVWSSALIKVPEMQVLISANQDAGTLSRISLSDPAERDERALGRHVRTVAAGPAGQVAVTGMVEGTLWLLDARTLETQHALSLGGRPYGVIWDKVRRLYWVTRFEASELVGVSPDGEVVVRQPVPDTPRGLALLSDGRLLISHMLTGEVSVWQVTSGTPAWLQTLRLDASGHPDEFVPQGLPRGLDVLAVSPDEKEIWMPHVLWNFDHPFQFQSTIFPAISVLEVGETIRERVDHRKALFRQINLKDTRNRTLIVSNPQAAVFSESGERVYVTFAGSEDLIVFDRGRARADSKKKRRGRRRGKHSEGGAQAVQIVRPLPGGQPWSLVREGQTLYVQNVQSRTLTALDLGDGGPFSRVRVAHARWAVASEHDRLSPVQRAGSRLFHLGRTSANQRYPVTGDNWMSCSSCHVDGFNFTNRFLMDAHGQDKHENAMTGHAHLKGLIASTFVGDYIRIIQDTQGGLGHDDRDGAEKVAPDTPPAEVVQAMQQLHSYVKLRENLPFVSTWMRLDDDHPIVRPQEWISSAACAECHAELFGQWADSNHRLMGESNPYYRVLEDIAGETEGQAFRSWCVGCHNPQRLTSGLPFRGEANRMYEKGGAGLKAAYESRNWALDEGTGCIFCHRITRLEDAGGNAAYTVNLQDRPVYPGEHSPNKVLAWAGDRLINASPGEHANSYSQPFYNSSEYCRGCHDEFSPGHGARIVTTYEEWANSSFNAPGTDKHRTCIDCHMHADPARIGEPIPGRSTEGGRLKDNVVTHQFTGANHHLAGLRNPELARQSVTLLKRSAEVKQWLDGTRLVVRVRNTGAGHALPTGVADFRQLWLAVRVTDAAGRVVLESGFPDAAGHLPDDTRLFMKVFGDTDGKPVGLRFWRYAKLLSDTRIPADGYRDEAFELPPDTVWPVQVETRLNFRIYPQWVTDAVKQAVPELPDPPVLTLNTVTSTFGERATHTPSSERK